MPLILPNAPQFSRYESNVTAAPEQASGTTVNHYVTTAHTKNPTCTELIASTAFDAQLVLVTLSNNSVANTNSSTLLDILIGAASSESVVIPDLCAGWVGLAQHRQFIFPLYIPAGSRLSARTQSVRVTGGVDVLVELYGGPRNPEAWWYGQEVTAYGENAANSAGTKFTPGNTGAETATPVSVGTTTAHHECLVLGVQGHPDDAAWAQRFYHIDVGIDTSSTSWLVQDSFLAVSTASETIGPSNVWWPIFTPVPSGADLVVGGECDSTADALSAVVYGVS